MKKKIETSDRKIVVFEFFNENDEYFVETKNLYGDYDNATAYKMRADKNCKC